MPEDWRTLVDANLYSINTNSVPEVIHVVLPVALGKKACWSNEYFLGFPQAILQCVQRRTLPWFGSSDA